MIQCDRQIWKYALNDDIINPFCASSIRKIEATDHPVISYGLSSYGYDVRLSPEDFLIYDVSYGGVVDPKRFDTRNLRKVSANSDEKDTYFLIPPQTYALGVTLEHISMPSNISAIAIGKSTYARCGLIVNCTPMEAGWRGHITLEMFNSSSSPLKVYANEGIVQLLFFEGEQCETTYADRAGKYQDQGPEVTIARI